MAAWRLGSESRITGIDPFATRLARISVRRRWSMWLDVGNVMAMSLSVCVRGAGRARTGDREKNGGH
jgi:hypothetical protein